VGLLAALVALAWLLAVRFGPAVWLSLFPTPPPTSEEPGAAIDPEVVSLALDQAVVAGGGELPPKPGGGEGAVVALPRGLSPRQLESTLRGDPRLVGASVYITRSDALLWSLRVFAGGDLLLMRELRPWLLASPPHPPGNPPEIAVLVDLRNGGGERALRWKAPLGVVVEPFAPSTLRHARDAAKASRSVVGAVRLDEPLGEQLEAIPHIGAVLVEAPLPESVDLQSFLAPLVSAGLALIDACPRGCLDAEAVQKAGVPLLRVAATVGREDGPGEDAEIALARNLAVQWGYGLILAPGTEDGLRRAESLIAAARADGLPIVFVEEAGRLHGAAPLPL